MLHVLVSLVVLVFILSLVGVSDVVARLGSADPGWILAALLACSAQIILCAFRWRITAARLGASIGIGNAIGEYYLSSAVNTTVPGGVVGDALRAVRTRHVAGFETIAQAVVIERLAGQIALGAVLILGLAMSGRPELQWPAAAAICFLVVLGALGPVLHARLPDQILPGVVRRFGLAIKASWFDRREAIVQIVLSVSIVAANLAAFSAAARATGSTIGFPDILFAVPLILAAMLIPFSVAGWGYREGAAAAVFPLIGASAAAGVSASVAFGAVILIASLPGALMLLVRNEDPGREPATEASAEHESAE